MSTEPVPSLRFADEYRNNSTAAVLADQLTQLIEPGRNYQIMEVCGGHTHAIFRHGLLAHVPDSIEFVHGPGCPVCVLPKGRIDDAVHLANLDGVIFTTYGDVMRVPGSGGSLLDASADGADVRVVYSPLDALALAEANPDHQIIFLAIGFETTAPATAIAVQQAELRGITNFSIFCNHVTVVPPVEALLSSDEVALDGLIGPGHVSAIIGCRPYEPLAEDFGLPIVVTGFEPLDVLSSLVMILEQLAAGRHEVENQYSRLVEWDGNQRALDLFQEVYEVRDTFEWRGLGQIPRSGLSMSPRYAFLDAEVRFGVPGLKVPDPRACRCGDVLRGVLKPPECKVFGTACTPEHPIGSCMVSSEGACAAYYQHGSPDPVPVGIGATR